jgi:hypothetical protein
MPATRLSIQHDVKTRDNTTDKDSTTTNGFVEKNESGVLYTIKRPGITLSANGAGVANGTFLYNDKLYFWDSFSNPLNPNIYPITYINGNGYFAAPWSPSETYTPGSPPIVYEDPYDSSPTVFYPQGTILTPTPPTKNPNNVGSVAWGTSPYVPSVSTSSANALAALLAYLSALNLGTRFTPTSIGPASVGYSIGSSYNTPGPANPPYTLPNAYVLQVSISYVYVPMGGYTNLLQFFVPFYF